MSYHFEKEIPFSVKDQKFILWVEFDYTYVAMKSTEPGNYYDFQVRGIDVFREDSNEPLMEEEFPISKRDLIDLAKDKFEDNVGSPDWP